MTNGSEDVATWQVQCSTSEHYFILYHMTCLSSILQWLEPAWYRTFHKTSVTQWHRVYLWGMTIPCGYTILANLKQRKPKLSANWDLPAVPAIGFASRSHISGVGTVLVSHYLPFFSQICSKRSANAGSFSRFQHSCYID